MFFIICINKNVIYRLEINVVEAASSCPFFEETAKNNIHVRIPLENGQLLAALTTYKTISLC